MHLQAIRVKLCLKKKKEKKRGRKEGREGGREKRNCVKRMKRKPQTGRKIFAKHLCNNGQITRRYKEVSGQHGGSRL